MSNVRDSPADTLHHLSERLHLVGGTLWVAANMYELGVQHKRLDSSRLSVILGLLEEVLGEAAVDKRHNDFVGIDLGPVMNILASLLAHTKEREDAGAPIGDDRLSRAAGVDDPVTAAVVAGTPSQPGRPEGRDEILRIDRSGEAGATGVPHH